MNNRLDLTAEVEPSGPVDRLLEATLPIPAAHRDGDGARAMIREHPHLTSENIWVACATGNLDAVRRFLATAPSLATTDGGTRNWDPLLYLSFSVLLRVDDPCAERMLGIARLLLDAGADPNSSWTDPQEAEGNRETPLYGAAGVANRVELARLLIDCGADPNDGETAYHMVEHDGVPCAEFIFPKLVPLHRGIALGHKLDYEDLAGLRTLLDLGADPNGPTPFGNWPIHQAVWRCRAQEYFDLLLEHGADLDKPNGAGRTAYAMAARSGNRRIMDWLVGAGASTVLQPTDSFIAACATGDRDRARSLLDDNPSLLDGFSDRDRSEICEAGANGNAVGLATMIDMGWDVNTRGVVWGETAAHRAAMDGHLDALKLAVERGADLTIVDRQYHCTPVGWAQHGERQAVIDYLKSLPERLDIWDAIELGQTERALELVGAIDPNAAIRGAPAGVLLRLAATRGLHDVVDALLARGADPTLRTPYGACAIDVAREFGHEEIAARLEKHARET